MDVQPLMFTGSPQVLFEALATLCAGLFAGTALYITFVEHPARLECGAELAATEFGPSYRRATLMQASLAATGLLMALGVWAQDRVWAVLVGGLLLGLVIPFTLIAILPTNKRLLDPGLDRSSTECAGVRSAPLASRRQLGQVEALDSGPPAHRTGALESSS